MTSSETFRPPLETPVALIIFNRPESTSRVFSAIAKAKPKKLLIISDGPRKSRAGEEKLVEECRRIALSVDWDCEVLTNFSDINLGCRDRVSTGLDWVFSEVGEAIILEDDCLPSQDFFRFTSELLERFRNDERIGSISGTYEEGLKASSHSYHFSQFPRIWGWATWARVWRKYDVAIRQWPGQKRLGFLRTALQTQESRRFWRQNLDAVHSGRIDTWDYQLSLLHWSEKLVSVIPHRNLVSNIGFGPDATHTLNSHSSLANSKTQDLEFPLDHPKVCSQNQALDRAYEQSKFSDSPALMLVTRIFNYLPKSLQEFAKKVFGRLRG